MARVWVTRVGTPLHTRVGAGVGSLEGTRAKPVPVSAKPVLTRTCILNSAPMELTFPISDSSGGATV